MIFVESLLVFVIIALIWLLVTALMFKKLNKARIKGVVLIFLAFVAVAIVIFVVGHFLEWHESNEMCGEMCHAMEGPYESYTQPKNNTMMETHFEADVPCAQCHSGPGFIGLGTSFMPVPNEMLHEYLLGYDEDDFGGHVPAENCLKGCHEEAGVDWIFEAPKPVGEGYSEVNGTIMWERRNIFHPYTNNATSLKELEELETCLDCHDARDNSFGFAAEACTICHDLEHEELEAHGESTCSMATCHRDKDGNPVQPKLTGHNTVTDHCMECHSRDHPDDAFVPYTITNSKGTTLTFNKSYCNDCHEEAYEELSTINSKHYTENDCTECHLEHKTRPECLSCHDSGSGIEPVHLISSPFDECTSCHEEGGHNPLSINFKAQQSTVVSRDFCTSCHQTDVYDNFVDDKLHTKVEFTEDCLSCHDAHEADVECTECHVAEGLADPPTHLTTLPFDECLDCHTQGHIPTNLNFTYFTTNNGMIEDDFCVNCHTDKPQILADYGQGHETQDCSICHGTHEKEDVDCQLCHEDGGIAPLPPHNIQNQYMDCVNCHENGHAPKNVTFPRSSTMNVGNDFCSDVSCHGGSYGIYEIFESYGGKHNRPTRDNDCQFCHAPHVTYDAELTPGVECTDCHSISSLTDHDQNYSTNQDCLRCHNSAHDPLNTAPHPGSALSQRDYMTDYYIMSIPMRDSFTWVPRGNHEEYTDCTECHQSAEETTYSTSAQALMNVSNTDCAGSCHTWINPTSTGLPIDLFTSATEWTNHTVKIFNRSTNGGCAGYCHQTDMQNPVYDGTGHGAINSCLTTYCHGIGFQNKIHDDHVKHVEDFTIMTGVGCGDVCHEEVDPDEDDPIYNGGCYDCHKSGHDPSIMATSPCYGCHDTNKKNQP